MSAYAKENIDAVRLLWRPCLSRIAHLSCALTTHNTGWPVANWIAKAWHTRTHSARDRSSLHRCCWQLRLIVRVRSVHFTARCLTAIPAAVFHRCSGWPVGRKGLAHVYTQCATAGLTALHCRCWQLCLIVRVHAAHFTALCLTVIPADACQCRSGRPVMLQRPGTRVHVVCNSWPHCTAAAGSCA
jgi:hypothetical protein